MRRRRLRYTAHRAGFVPRRPHSSSAQPPGGPVDRYLLRPGWVEECRVMAHEGRALGMAFHLLGLCLGAGC